MALYTLSTLDVNLFLVIFRKNVLYENVYICDAMTGEWMMLPFLIVQVHFFFLIELNCSFLSLIKFQHMFIMFTIITLLLLLLLKKIGNARPGEGD